MNAQEHAHRLKQEIQGLEAQIELKLKALERLVSHPTLVAETVQEIRVTVDGDVLTPITDRQLSGTVQRANFELEDVTIHSPTVMTIHPRRLLRICLELEELRKESR